MFLSLRHYTEAAGLAPGCAYLVALILLQAVHLYLGGEVAMSWALEYNSVRAVHKLTLA